MNLAYVFELLLALMFVMFLLVSRERVWGVVLSLLVVAVLFVLNSVFI